MKESPKPTPPRWATKLLQWYCAPHLIEEVQGDLQEEFEYQLKQVGETKARFDYVRNVFGFIRPFAIKRKKSSSNNYGMFKNYFKTALRNLVRSKFYSGLNLLGLTLGLTVGLLILLWVNQELSYDSFHKKADQIYRVNVNLESSGNKFAVQVVQPTVAHYGLSEVPGIQQAVRITNCNDYSVFRYQDVVLKDNAVIYTDPSLFKIFDYPLLKGNPDNPFPVTESVVLTQSAAKRFFGEADPLGKVLLADNKDNFVVSGIMADFPENSWLKCEMLFSTDLVRKQYKERGWGSFDENSWGNYGWVTFLQLQQGTSLKSIEDQLTKINVSHQPNLRPVDVGFYTLQPLRDIHL